MADLAITLKIKDTDIIRTVKKWKIDQFGDAINLTIQKSDASAKDITGTTPHLILRNFDMSIAYDFVCSIVSGTGGTCKYVTLSGDFPEPRLFYLRVDLYTGTTKIEGTEEILFMVQ